MLIAVDGTDSDRSIIRQTLEVLGPDRDYVLVSVSNEPAMIGAASLAYATAAAFDTPELSRFADGIDDDADQVEDAVKEVARQAGLDSAESIGEVGDPATVLIELAEERVASVIAIGASDRSWFSRLWDRSVEAAVVDRAPCPVLVLHPN